MEYLGFGLDLGWIWIWIWIRDTHHFGFSASVAVFHGFTLLLDSRRFNAKLFYGRINTIDVENSHFVTCPFPLKSTPKQWSLKCDAAGTFHAHTMALTQNLNHTAMGRPPLGVLYKRPFSPYSILVQQPQLQPHPQLYPQPPVTIYPQRYILLVFYLRLPLHTPYHRHPYSLLPLPHRILHLHIRVRLLCHFLAGLLCYFPTFIPLSYCTNPRLFSVNWYE